jgi:hypothetical protein
MGCASSTAVQAKLPEKKKTEKDFLDISMKQPNP